MTTVHLVHGFNVRDNGAATTDRLIPYFSQRGFTARQHDYGWQGLIGVRFANPRVASRVAASVQPGDIGCGHSNGCAILAAAADLGAPFAGLVLINPALESGRAIAPQVKWFHVYHNRGDKAVEAAEVLDWLPWNWGWLPWNSNGGQPWGDMGNRGHTGRDPRCRNFDAAAFDPPVTGHSGMFSALEIWGPRIVNLARLDLDAQRDG